MITDPSGTTTFPDHGTTLDEYYWDAQDSLWCIYFGNLFAWALFACLLIQVYLYHVNFPNDRCLIKSAVALLTVLEIGATGLLTWTGYVSQVVHWGHESVYVPGIWAPMIIDCLVASVVHGLYTWRIYRLITRRWLAVSLTVFVIFLSFGQASFCIAAAMCAALQPFTRRDNRFLGRKMFHGWLILATLADIVITIAIALKLYSARTGVPSTDRSINKLLYVFIPGGAFTALVTLAILIIQLFYTGTNYYQTLIICLSKFYSNSVLLCLNLRASKATLGGKHTMLTGFQTNDEHLASSRRPFDVQIERTVEKGTSSGVFYCNPHSDEAGASSDMVVVEEEMDDRRQGISDAGTALHLSPDDSAQHEEKGHTLTHHPFQSSVSIVQQKVHGDTLATSHTVDVMPLTSHGVIEGLVSRELRAPLQPAKDG